MLGANELKNESVILPTTDVSANRLPCECHELASLITTYTYNVDSSTVLGDVKLSE